MFVVIDYYEISMNTTRTHNVIKNTIWELGYYIFVVALGFLAPRYIILIYGSSVNGLSATITQILNVILLLQAGAATAAIYSLYKPIANEDVAGISSKLASATAYFKKLSLIFLLLMIVAAYITAFYVKSEIPPLYIFVAFIILGLKSFLDLYFTSTFRILFTAFQEKFVLSIATLIEQVVYYVLVFTTLFFRWHFLFLFLWLFLGCIAKIIYLDLINKKKHPEIVKKKEITKNSPSVIVGKNYALANEISHSIMTTSTAIMISFMYGLKEASVYSVYTLVFSALYLIMTSLYSSFGPSFGNLYASGYFERSKEVFSIFQFIYLMVNAVMMICTIYLLLPFVSLYVSGVSDINYHNETLVVLSVISATFSAFRIPYNVMVSSLGFFKETWLQPVITGIVCLGLSYIAGLIDYAYILLGPIVFYSVNFLYQHFRLMQLVPNMIDNRVFTLLFITVCGIGLSFYLYKIYSWDVSIFRFIGGAICLLLFSMLYLVLTTKFFLNKLLLASIDYVGTIIKKRNE